MQRSFSFIRWSGTAAMLRGVLWIPYGVFEMLEPWGAAKVYREDVGYSVTTDTSLFIAYSLPGNLALLLTSLGLLGVPSSARVPTGRLANADRILTYVAIVLGVLSLGGVLALFDAVFTAGRIFGTLVLGVATFLAGVAVHRAGAARGCAITLLAVGLLGMFLLPLWPLVYAVNWLPEGVGAALITLFGLGWLALGWSLRFASA